MKNYISWEHYEADRADRRTLLIWRIVIGLLVVGLVILFS